MPQPIFYQQKSPLGGFFGGFTGAFNQALEKGMEENKLKQQGTILQQTLQNLGPNPSFQDITQVYNSLHGKVSPDVLKNAFSLYEPYIKEQLKRETTQKNLRYFGLLPSENNISQIAPEQPQVGNNQGVVNQPQMRFSDLSEDQLVALKASGSPEIAKSVDVEVANRKEKNRRFIADRDFHTGQNKKILEEADELEKSLSERKFASKLARDAVERGEVGPTSVANIARRLGIPEFESFGGAQLNLATKQYLTSALQKFKARAQNVFIEKRVLDAFAKIGQSEEANLGVLDALDFIDNHDEIYINELRKLQDADIEKYGYSKEGLNRRAIKASEELIKEEENKFSFRSQQHREREAGLEKMIENSGKKVPKGTYLTPEMAVIFIRKYKSPDKVIENAKKLGYEIPTKEERDRWQLEKR